MNPNPKPNQQVVHPRSQGRTMLAAIAMLMGITALIYLPAASHRLLDWDDTTYVTGNPKMADLHAIWTGWSSGYMPVTETFWWLIYQRYGVQPGPYHVLNIGFHLLNVLLVFALLRQLTGRWPGRELGGFPEAAPALLGAALFAWHPIQAEAVCWVTSLKDLASAFFCLIALNAHALFLKPQTTASPCRWVWYWMGVIAFGLAMLAKPTVIAMLVAAFIMGKFFYDRSWGRSMRDLLPWLLIALFPLAVNAVSQSGLYQGFDVPVRYRLFVALDALSFYCGKLVWPWELLPAYGRTPRYLLDSGAIWWGWIPGAVLLALTFWRRKQWPGLWLGVCVSVLALLPVLGLMQFAAQNNSTVYDHYLYLGMAGPAIALAWLLCRRPLRRRAIFLIAAVLLGLALKSATQTSIWRNDYTLWTYTLNHRAESEVALVSMGKLHAAGGAYVKARDYYERAVREAPWSVEAHNNLGACLAKTGKLDSAKEHFEAALKLNPDLIAAHDNLAEYWLVRDRWDNAGPHIRYVLEHQGAHIGANSKLAEHLLKTAQAPECIRLLEPVVRPISGHANLYNLLGVAYGQNGQPSAALSAFQTAVRLDPLHAGATLNLRQAQKDIIRQ
ncbi:MAG: tetratricopeptide repeat protein [Kiritimatiellae bacterium]|nr:tetratricopeptide repeat protein [Kiritimatiellia bacterium]